jgi:hypothetical protein
MTITVWASTWIVGSEYTKEIEIDDEDLEGLSEEEQSEFIDSCAREVIWDLIEWGWRKEGE